MTHLESAAGPPDTGLDRTFRILVIDWDSTTESDRGADGAGLMPTIDRLLRAGVQVVLLGNALESLPRRLTRGPHLSRLHLRDDDRAAVLRWVVRILAPTERVLLQDILLIGGDGLRIPEVRSATVVAAPPADAEGPAGCRRLLEAQARRHPVELPGVPTVDPEWLLVEEGFEITREHEVESLHTVANGHLGVRNSLAEGSPLSQPGTFAAGLFDHPDGGVPELASLPDWALLEGTIDGQRIRVDQGTVVAHHRILDLRQGVAWRMWQHRLPDGREIRIEGMRLASRADRHLLLQSVVLTSSTSGRLIVDGALAESQRVAGAGMASATELTRPETVHRLAASRLSIDISPECPLQLDRAVAVVTERDAGDPVVRASAHLEAVQADQGLHGAFRAHVDAWQDLWRDADIRILGDTFLQRALRVASYHLLSSVDPTDHRVSVGARGLTGAVYKGHVFWDTEIFMLPMLTLTWPEAARALIGYRHHTLPAARARAAEMGYRGALYAWESADTGEDVTPSAVIAPDGEVVPLYVGVQQQHISADIAYAVWRYWQTTGDDAFLLDQGAEILFETARFWASRVEPGDDDLLHIRNVIGPDEYHVSVDDNAFTNVMAVWNLERAAEVAWLIGSRWPEAATRMTAELGVTDAEVARWSEMSARIYTGFDRRTGLFEQFKGYFDLEHILPADHEPRSAPLDVLLGRERVQQSQILKQADVVMLLHLLEEWLPRPVREANFRFYEPRTGHGSSLSPPIHASVAARLGDLDCAERYLRQTMGIDLGPEGSAAGGMHMAALGGLWQAVVFGFGGLELTTSGPRLRPRLLPGWRGLEMQVRWHGQRYRLIAGGAS